MAKKKKQSAEFRIYELPQGEDVLALTGEKWVQIYGRDVDNLHFHNLLEIGICYYGEGKLIIEDKEYPFGKDMLSFIPMDILHTTKSEPTILAFWEYLFINPESLLQEMYHGKKSGWKPLLEIINREGFFIKKEENPFLFCLVHQIFQELREKKPYYKEAVKGLLLSLLLEAARQNMQTAAVKEAAGISEKKSGEKLDRAVAFIEQNYTRSFKIAELAEECYMSETHFRRFFQERMNMTPVDILILCE